jgi:hypothetical protein
MHDPGKRDVNGPAVLRHAFFHFAAGQFRSAYHRAPAVHS